MDPVLRLSWMEKSHFNLMGLFNLGLQGWAVIRKRSVEFCNNIILHSAKKKNWSHHAPLSSTSHCSSGTKGL